MSTKLGGKTSTKMPALLPHNEPAYAMLEQVLDRNNKAIIVSATGTGKSYIAAKYVGELHENAVVVCPKRSIKNSWESLIPGVSTMTYQYLSRMSQEDILVLPYTCWIFDEAHHCCGPEWQKNITFLMENASSCKFIGLTADPVRHSDGGLDVSKELFGGNVVKGLELHEAISQDVLPSFTYISTVFGLDNAIGEAKEKAATPGPNRYRIAEKITRLQNSLQNQYQICEILNKHMPEGKRKGVVFVDCIAALSEAMDIMRLWAGNNAKFLTMHSRRPVTETNAVMEQFREIDDGYVFAIDMLNEGLHFPGVNTVIMFRHTESPNVYFQQIGRGLAANGENPVIFDFVGNRKSLATRSTAGRETLLTGNSSDRKAQANVILYDYANEALDLLDEIRDLLNGKWTEEEKEILRKYYSEEGGSCCKRLPGRSRQSCQNMAADLGLKYDHLSQWTQEEENILTEYYPLEGIHVVNRLQGRTEAMVYNHVKALGLKRNKFFSDEEDGILRRYYPEEGTDVAKRLPGKTPEQCQNRAHTLKIRCLSSSVCRWSHEEDEILKEFYPVEGRKVAKRLKGRSESACYSRAVTALHLSYGDEPKMQRWTKDEISILREYYPSEGAAASKRLPGRNKNQCKSMARNLGIKASSNIWTDDEVSVLRLYYPTEGTSVEKRLPGRTAAACANAAHKYGLHRPGGQWSEEELAVLDEYYPTEGTAVAERIPARSAEACKRMARIRGLKKDTGAWTENELAILKKYYPIEGRAVAKRLPGRDGTSCYNKAWKLSLSAKKHKNWTEEEISVLKEYYPTEGILTAQRLPERSVEACKQKARDLGLQICQSITHHLTPNGV